MPAVSVIPMIAGTRAVFRATPMSEHATGRFRGTPTIGIADTVPTRRKPLPEVTTFPRRYVLRLRSRRRHADRKRLDGIRAPITRSSRRGASQADQPAKANESRFSPPLVVDVARRPRLSAQSPSSCARQRRLELRRLLTAFSPNLQSDERSTAGPGLASALAASDTPCSSCRRLGDLAESGQGGSTGAAI
jgi:hypothetical protein